MPLSMAEPGAVLYIKRIGGKDEIRQHLAELGFVVGGMVKVISIIGGNIIVQVKESRIALSREMAVKIIV